MFFSPLEMMLASLEFWGQFFRPNDLWQRQLAHNALLVSDGQKRLISSLVLITH
jgi:hypothetical protein